MANTIPQQNHTHSALVRFYNELAIAEPMVQFGGTWANKSGYHDYRSGLPVTDYSVRLTMDKEGPSNLCSALDISFKDARESSEFKTIAKYSNRLYVAMKNNDSRLYYKGKRVVREFFGNIDLDRTVEGWTLCSTDGCHSRAATSDNSHQWHIHISFQRWVWGLGSNTWYAIKGVLDILLGKPIVKPQPVEIYASLGEWVMATGLPARVVRVKGTTAQYSVTLKGLEHIKNATHRKWLLLQGWITEEIWDVSQSEFNQLNEKE